MGYLKVDDNAADHPKLAGLSDAAFRVWFRGCCYAARLATDGFIPAAVVEGWTRRPALIVGELLRAVLWHQVEGGYQIHDFLHWNDSAEMRRQRIAAKVERQAKWKARRREGDASPARHQRRDGDAPPTPTPTPTPTPSREERARPLIGSYVDKRWAFDGGAFRIPVSWEVEAAGRSGGRLTGAMFQAFYQHFAAWVKNERVDITGNRLFRALDAELARWRERQEADAELEAGRDTVRKLREQEAAFRARQSGGVA